MAKSYRKLIGSRTDARVNTILRREYIVPSGTQLMPSLTGKRYVMIVKDDYLRITWLFLLARESDSGE